MKIVVGETEYTTIKDLSFSPQADITGSELAVNEYIADIVTEDVPSTGEYAILYDDMDRLWAKYRIVEAHKVGDGLTRIEAQSTLRSLVRRMKGAIMYNNTPVTDAIAALFKSQNSYTLDSSFTNKTLTGYCPKQSAKDRLQWICFYLGAYCKTFFNDKIEILPVSDSEIYIPIPKTYWRPTVNYEDYVTSVSVTSYTYTQGTPQTTDEWVKAGGNTYIVTSQEFTLANPSAPSNAPENVVTVDDVTIINDNNVSDILSLLSTYYFKRITVDADIIDNAEFLPADKVTIATSEDAAVVGYISSADFSFGLQSKARVHIAQTDLVDGAKLIIVRKYNGTTLRKDQYTLPLGYEYSIQNPYIDQTKGDVRRIYRPLNAYATGTMSSAKVTNTQNYAIALQYSKKVLDVISVDEVEVQTSSGNRIGVIA